MRNMRQGAPSCLRITELTRRAAIMAYRHIVVATDLSEDAEFLLGKGARLAAALKAKLSLIYIDI
ncbi:universal stress protein, partial [Enterococcus faecium]|uniref:universal stress protein n=1 Tax=Enterococcus faecium TaxID=1352 RepID=UPI001C556D96